jgi:hypothetical protein
VEVSLIGPSTKQGTLLISSSLASGTAAAITLAGIELMHMIRKGQLEGRAQLRPAQQFYSLACGPQVFDHTTAGMIEYS